MNEYNIKKVGKYFVAFDKVDKKVSYGKIHIETGKFIGGTKCAKELYEYQENYSLTNKDGLENIINRVVDQMEKDINSQDQTAICELLRFVPIEYLKGYLAED